MAEEKTVQKENPMGTRPINSLLISMSLPIMISMIVQALYNIVDSMFVARVSENALTAVSLAFPVQNLMISVATGTGVGINALLSRSLGEKNFDRANRTAKNGIFLLVVSAIVFAIVGGVFSHMFFAVQTNDAEIVEAGTVYTRICTIWSIGLFMQITMERLLQATGKSIYSMVTQLTGAVINIILDPIMIFGLLGFPKMGVAGAALATVVGQTIAACLAVFFNLKKNTELNYSFRGFRPDGEIIRHIYAVGVPSIIMASISSVMNFGMNKILMTFSSTATAVFGVYYKLQSFVFMPTFGLNNGMVPILAYNLGARKKKRMIRTIRLSVIYAISIMLIGLAVFQLIPSDLLRLFDASEDMLAIGIPALRIISLSFTFAGFCVVSSSVFQALGHGFLSLMFSLIRQLVVLLPVAYILSRFRVLNLVWWSFPIAEVAGVILCIFFLMYAYRKEIKPIPDEKTED